MPHDNTLTRRSFVKSVGAAGSALWAASAIRAADEPPVTLAVLGAAHIHVPMFLQMLQMREDVRVAYVWDHDAARAEKYAAECGAKTAKAIAEVLDDAAVAGVLVLSETSRHAELAIPAAAAGKHVFVEKPLAASAQDAAAIAAAIEKAGVLFNTGYHLRSASRNVLVKEQIALGNLGQIVRAQASYCNDCALHGDFDNQWKWTVDRRWGGLGSLADIGTHAVDLLMWLLGDVESVSADLRSVTHRYPDCDETGQGLLRFKSGVTGSVAGGWVEPANPVSLLVSGTEGHAVVLNDRLYLRTDKLEGADGTRPWMKLAPPLDHPLLLFASAVGGQRELPLVTAGEAAARVRVMEAMYQSAQERRWVRVG